MKFLAGLVEEDDIEEVRYQLAESYQKQFEEDVVYVSENVTVLESDDWRFNKLLGFENVIDEPVVLEEGEHDVYHGHGLGPGFQGYDGTSREPYDPYAQQADVSARWMMGGNGLEQEQTGDPEHAAQAYSKDGAPVLPGEMANPEDLEILPFDAIEALEALAQGNDVAMLQDDGLRDELMQQGLVALAPQGGFELTQKGLAYIGAGTPGLNESVAGVVDGGHVRYDEDEDKQGARGIADAMPKGWSYYEPDHAYQAIKKRKSDPLALDEAEEQEEALAKFLKKYTL